MVKLEEILRQTVKEKYLGIKGKNFKAKLQRALNLYVNDIARFPDGSIGQIASIGMRASGNGGEITLSYYRLAGNYDEKRLKQVSQKFSFNSTSFSITYMQTPRQEIAQVDYSNYKGRSGAAAKNSA
ncbi:hypothetical protein HYV89_03275 [Candidatus Woesearchaeota archaeon]|nr:hypothetical protein [Candidatus Woesearchaeota archaeon]